MALTLTPVLHIPLIQSGDPLGEILAKTLLENNLNLMDGDILIITQKIVSKSEGRLYNLSEIHPSAKALDLANITDKDPRFVELVLKESKTILRAKPGILIAEHKKGFICANAGIDHSNVQGTYGNQDDWVLLLPEDSDRSALEIKRHLEIAFSVSLGVIIIDSHGRPWRMCTTGSILSPA